ncbi:MATE family efflux transporter [Virgibacillus sp. MG-45]|uniref:MATE family efflux transporter n=1 Tax=Virgibacillus sp. MG-45 TaxID=3102791 RepID=UPI002ED8E28C
MNELIYDRYSINRLIFTFSLPAIASLIIETMTSIVDTSFAGHLGEQSADALTAMGLIAPLLAGFIALQTLYAFSTSIMISTFLGENKTTTLNNYFQTGFLMTVVLSASTSFLIWLFIDPILLFLGAKGAVYSLAYDYLMIILISNIFSSIGYTLTSSIRAFGKPNVEAIIISLSVVSNIVLNALLTFGLQLGITGIALGTLISEIVCAVLSVMYLIKMKRWFPLQPLSLKSNLSIAYQLFKLGLAQTIIQLLAGITAFIVNHQLINIGGNNYVANWNIANKLYMLMLMPIIGITQAIQTIIAFFNGKKEREKQHITVKKTIKFCFIYGIGSMLVVFAFGESILRLFTLDPAIITATLAITKVIFITFPLLGITYTIMTVLQVTGGEMYAVLLGVMRQVITVIPLVILLPLVFEKQSSLGVEPAFTIFFAIPLADLLTLIIAIIIHQKKRRSIQ